MNGYALLIGVNEINKKHYLQDYKLDCALKDTEVMKELLERIPSYKGNITCLNRKEATWKNACDEIQKHVDTSQQEDGFLVIYYTGHGTRSKSSDRGFFSFYDKLVSEYEIKRELSKLSKRFKTFLISDSCHSGELIDKTRVLENFNSKFLSLGIENNLKLREGEVKTIPSTIFEKICRANAPDYDNVLKEAPMEFIPDSEIAILTACEKEQTAEMNVDEDMPSLFTRTIITTWSKNNCAGYDSFHRNLIYKNTKKAKPEFKIYGKEISGFFSSTKPFLFNGLNDVCIADLLTDVHFEEDNTTFVKFQSFPNSNYKFVASKSFHTSDPEVKDIVSELSGCIDDISVIGIVFASEHISSGQPLPQPIFGFRPVPATSPGDHPVDAIVVVVDWFTGKVLHKGRTKGKVSNDIGFD